MHRYWMLALCSLSTSLLVGCQAETPESAPVTNTTSPPVEENAPTSLVEVKNGFTLLTLADFEPFQADSGTWKEEDGILICEGTPKGYLYSRDTFGNFTLRVEYRYVPAENTDNLDKSNTGFMIHIQEPHKTWPRSLEVQGRWDEMCSIKANGGVPDLTIDDHPEIRERVRKPVGEWNTVEIISKDGALTAMLNGEQVCESQAGELKQGLIGLQAEGFAVHFRNLRIRND